MSLHFIFIPLCHIRKSRCFFLFLCSLNCVFICVPIRGRQYKWPGCTLTCNLKLSVFTCPPSYGHGAAFFIVLCSIICIPTREMLHKKHTAPSHWQISLIVYPWTVLFIYFFCFGKGPSDSGFKPGPPAVRGVQPLNMGWPSQPPHHAPRLLILKKSFTEHGEQPKKPKKLLLSQLQLKLKLRSRSLSKLADQDTKVIWLQSQLRYSAVVLYFCYRSYIFQCCSLSLIVTKQRDPETGQQSLLFQVCTAWLLVL